MNINLSLHEARVIGSLIEKEITTPDQYPLSLNALLNACNQKSNREPVLDIDELTLQETVDELTKKRFIAEQSGFGSRVVKLKQRFCNTEFSDLKFTPQELGVICVLLLRGPQTPGELRSRTNRLCQFADVQATENTLQHLQAWQGGPLVVQLPRESGKRESRYAHLFSGEVDIPAPSAQVIHPSSEDDSRIAALEQRVDELTQRLEALEIYLNE